MPLKVIKGRHGSPNYYLRGSVRGFYVDESTGTDKKREAEEIRAKREAELLEQSIHGVRAVATFARAAANYLERGGERRYLEPILQHFGMKRLSEIDQASIDACAVKLKPRAANSTVNRQIYTPVSAVLKHAHERNMCDRVIVKRPKQPKGKTRWLSLLEAEKLIADCSPHLAPLVIFLLYTGCRIREALYLEWAEIDLERSHVSICKTDLRGTKNGEDRGIPLHSQAAFALSRIKGRDGIVFRRPDGQPYMLKDTLDGGGQIKTAFKAACRRAGLRGVTPHTLRHTWASWYYRETHDLDSLMKLGGWKSLTMVMRYTHMNANENVQKINALPSLDPEKFREAVVANKIKAHKDKRL